MTTVNIQRVVDDTDRWAVFAFRYAVIVNELGVDIPTADHQRRVVIDPADRTGYLFAAYTNGEVIGTTRVNFLRDGPIEPHSNLLGFDRLPTAKRDVTSVSSRFLVAAPFRSTPVAIRITQEWYRFCRAAGIEFDYILVKAELADLYLRLGYHATGESVQHPEVGAVLPLRLHLADEAHLRSIRSPFVRCLSG